MTDILPVTRSYLMPITDLHQTLQGETKFFGIQDIVEAQREVQSYFCEHLAGVHETQRKNLIPSRLIDPR